jgi:hypothetical protein
VVDIGVVVKSYVPNLQAMTSKGESGSESIAALQLVCIVGPSDE